MENNINTSNNIVCSIIITHCEGYQNIVITIIGTINPINISLGSMDNIIIIITFIIILYCNMGIIVTYCIMIKALYII